MRRIEGVLGVVDYHQFYVLADGQDVDLEHPAHRSHHDVILPTDGHGFCVLTGISMGSINLAIEILDRPPDQVDQSREWEAVTDISFFAARTAARVQALMDWTPPPFDAFTLPAAPAWYRVRGHALGRSLDFDIVVTENPREHHLLQIWLCDGPEEPVDHRIDNRWEHQHPE